MASRNAARRAPGILPQETQGDVERGAAPALHRKQLRQEGCIVRRNQRHIVGGGIGSRAATDARRACWCRSREPAFPRSIQLAISPLPVHRASASCRGGRPQGGPGQPRKHRLLGPRRPPLDLALPLTITSPMKLSSRVARSRLRGLRKQFRSLIDELGGVVGGGETRMRDQLVEKAQVGDHAANPKLPQRAVHACDGLLRGRRPRVTLTSRES